MVDFLSKKESKISLSEMQTIMMPIETEYARGNNIRTSLAHEHKNRRNRINTRLRCHVPYHVVYVVSNLKTKTKKGDAMYHKNLHALIIHIFY